jgi:D-amino-acid dehydrogenase
MSARHVIIVGGGVIGTACAHFLTLSGWKVTLVERDRVGAACSHGNCGLVSPSHVLPLTTPGAVKTALKSLLSPSAPFRIKPRFDPALWAWLYRFARRCNPRDMRSAAHAIQALLNSSRGLYDDLLRSFAIDAEFERRGTLFVHQSRASLDHFAETNRLLSDEFAMPAMRFDADALLAMEPAIKPGAAAGAWHYPGDGHLRPDRLLSEWRRSLESRGVAILEGCEVAGFESDRHRARAVETSRGLLSADAFVVAAGALTPRLGRFLGCKIPIQPGKGYSITMARPARCPTYPLLFEEHRVVATPMRSGYRLGSTMEFAGYDTTLNRRRLDLLRDGARLYLYEPTCEPVEEEWYGWRPMTYDSVPIIGAAPALANVVIAAGHNMLGLSMATATGKLVTELANGSTPHIDPAPYAPTRF